MSATLPYSHCHYCGYAYSSEVSGDPEIFCIQCKRVAYQNPTPVPVLLIPTSDGKGLYGLRRGINPKKGCLALPGGFQLLGERWKVAGAREALEEIQIEIPSPLSNIRLFDVDDNDEGTRVLIFGIVRPFANLIVRKFIKSEEALERIIFTSHEWQKQMSEIAFPLHEMAITKYFHAGSL